VRTGSYQSSLSFTTSKGTMPHAVHASSSNATVLPNSAFIATTDQEVRVFPQADGTTIVTLTVVDARDVVGTDSFILTVDAIGPPSPHLHFYLYFHTCCELIFFRVRSARPRDSRPCH
jgi:hypothetical protein